jgi:hypothetical protein
MNFDQTTEKLDDALNHAGCALLSVLILTEQCGHSEWTNPEDANDLFHMLVASGIVYSDGSIQKWPELGDAVFGKGNMHYHYEPIGYSFKPGDYAAALYRRRDPADVNNWLTHFVACWPKELDPYPNSITRAVGALDSYRVFTEV